MDRELLAQRIEFLCGHVHKDAPENSVCEDCGELWNSEYHMSDECINLNEDRDD